MKYLKSYNEGIKHLLKGKDISEIKNKIDKLNLNNQQKMEYACRYGLLWLAEESIDKGYNVRYHSDMYMSEIIQSDSYEILNLLLNNVLEINDCLTWIEEILYHNRTNILKVLVSHGMVFNHSDFDINLIEQCYSPEILDILLKHSKNVYVEKNWLSYILTDKKNIDFIKVLIKNIPKVKENIEKEYEDSITKIDNIKQILS
jgi:predicted DNA-binding transcriptional regulator